MEDKAMKAAERKSNRNKRTATDIDREIERLSGEMLSGTAPGKLKEKYELLLSSRLERIGKVSSFGSLLKRKKKWEGRQFEFSDD